MFSKKYIRDKIKPLTDKLNPNFSSWHLSADKSLCAIITSEQNCHDIQIFDTAQNNYVYQDRIKSKLDNARELFDFSPDNNSYVLTTGDIILVMNMKTRRAKILLKGDIDNLIFLKFLDNNTIVYILDNKIYQHQLDGKITEHKVNIQGDQGLFLNRVDKNILIVLNLSLDEREKEYKTMIMEMDGKLSDGPPICNESYVGKFEIRNYMLLSGSEGFQLIVADFSDYLNGKYQIYKNNWLTYYWNIGGQNRVKVRITVEGKLEIRGIDVGWYLFKAIDKLFFLQHDRVSSISWKDFEENKLASCLLSGLDQPTMWGSFLTRGLYDPRLLINIWRFARP